MKQGAFIVSALRRVCPLGLILAGVVVASLPTPSIAITGYDHGFFWQNFASGGTSNLTFPQADTNAGNFQEQYTNVAEVIAGKGWNPGASRTVNYTANLISGGYNNFSVYGWTTNPLIEYYVCEKGSVISGTMYGALTTDGHTYTIYKHQQINFPSIQGTATFWQYLSNWGGTSIGANHAVTLGNHINFWKAHLGNFGTFNFQILAIEAYGGKSGTTNATVW